MLNLLIKENLIDINRLISKYQVELGLDNNEMVVLLKMFHLQSKGKVVSYSATKDFVFMKEDLLQVVLSGLENKSFIELELTKNDDNKTYEYYNLSIGVKKIDKLLHSKQIATEKTVIKNEKENLLTVFNRELGEPLSEFGEEVVGDLLQEYTFKEITDALKTSTKQGKVSLAYVEAVLRNKKSNEIEMEDNQSSVDKQLIDDFFENL